MAGWLDDGQEKDDGDAASQRGTRTDKQLENLRDIYGVASNEWLKFRDIWCSQSPLLPRQRFFRNISFLSSRPLANEVSWTKCTPDENLPPFFFRIGEYPTFHDVQLQPFSSYSLDQITHRTGFLVNTGMQVYATAWKGNYVAVGGQLKDCPPRMFEATPGPGVIQIWKVGTDASIVYVLNHGWGAVCDMAWAASAGDASSIGVLAIVSADGYARVIHVLLGKSKYSYLKMVDMPLNIGALATCLTWWENRLVVGYDNGYVAIYCSTMHRPLAYFRIHQTFVYKLITCSPTFPYLLASSSFDGVFALTDLRDHTSVSVDRQLMGPSGITWCDCMQSLLSCVDGSYVRMTPVRRLDRQTTKVARHQGMPWAVHSSPFHPFVLSAATDGCVVISNIARKSLLHRKQTNLTLTLFQVEVSKDGLRILENFQPANLELKHEKKLNDVKTRIYPREALIKCVAWNVDSLEYGEWMAAGFGTILRLENLGR